MEGSKWLEYRFGIACSECRAYMPSVWRHGSVVNSESRWKRSVAVTGSIKFSWMAKPSSMGRWVTLGVMPSPPRIVEKVRAHLAGE